MNQIFPSRIGKLEMTMLMDIYCRIKQIFRIMREGSIQEYQNKLNMKHSDGIITLRITPNTRQKSARRRLEPVTAYRKCHICETQDEVSAQMTLYSELNKYLAHFQTSNLEKSLRMQLPWEVMTQMSISCSLAHTPKKCREI